MEEDLALIFETAQQPFPHKLIQGMRHHLFCLFVITLQDDLLCRVCHTPEEVNGCFPLAGVLVENVSRPQIATSTSTDLGTEHQLPAANISTAENVPNPQIVTDDTYTTAEHLSSPQSGPCLGEEQPASNTSTAENVPARRL
jgi:hypothetical protein